MSLFNAQASNKVHWSNPALKWDRPCHAFFSVFVLLVIRASAATGVACPLALR